MQLIIGLLFYIFHDNKVLSADKRHPNKLKQKAALNFKRSTNMRGQDYYRHDGCRTFYLCAVHIFVFDCVTTFKWNVPNMSDFGIFFKK